MKFRKPELRKFAYNTDYDLACRAFLDALPDEFEIVPEGHVCVKWPDGVTKDGLREVAEVLDRDGYPNTSRVFRGIAAIDAERSKP